ncbi:allatotropins-like [Wyeomyia smithii]|uniref:allatotropins-like n=1 Tax=Wyeomyia smithii TaxID=174621 RepID=UPI002467EA85|nr:allatotropins-like [Wyeomyia smithii]XP_055529834.1 allatotropins-like [Wyeomyia smithii]
MEVIKMSACKLLFVVVLSCVLLCCHTSNAGPARQLASLAVRASKIPRSIRAPFRNSEMMTARGFGKRRVPIGANVGGSSGNSGATDEAPWVHDKRETIKLFEQLAADNNADPGTQIAGEQESFPLEWFANEMSTNPTLARTILQHFVDSNKDGLLTSNELISLSDGNDMF